MHAASGLAAAVLAFITALYAPEPPQIPGSGETYNVKGCALLHA